MIKLNQKQRIILKHIDGMSNRSIASELHMSHRNRPCGPQEPSLWPVPVAPCYYIKNMGNNILN